MQPIIVPTVLLRAEIKIVFYSLCPVTTVDKKSEEEITAN